MLLNDVSNEIKKLMIDDDVSQTELSNKMDYSVQYVSQLINGKNKFVNDKFIDIMNALGYDIRLEFVKQENR